MRSHMILVGNFDNPAEANLYRLRLEEESIECFLMDENTISMLPTLNQGWGSFKLYVHAEDREKAEKFIKNGLNNSPVDNDPVQNGL